MVPETFVHSSKYSLHVDSYLNIITWPHVGPSQIDGRMSMRSIGFGTPLLCRSLFSCSSYQWYLWEFLVPNGKIHVKSPMFFRPSRTLFTWTSTQYLVLLHARPSFLWGRTLRPGICQKKNKKMADTAWLADKSTISFKRTQTESNITRFRVTSSRVPTENAIFAAFLCVVSTQEWSLSS